MSAPHFPGCKDTVFTEASLPLAFSIDYATDDMEIEHYFSKMGEVSQTLATLTKKNWMKLTVFCVCK